MALNSEFSDLDIFPSFSKALFNDDVKDLSVNMLDMYITAAEFDLLSNLDIPIIKTGLALIKTGKNIKSVHEFKKIIAFIKQLQNGTRDPKELKKREVAYQHGEKWFAKEVELIMLYLSRCSTVYKSILLAELYLDLLNEAITFSFFQECLDIIDQIFIWDIPHLTEIHTAEAEIDFDSGNVPMEVLNEIDFDIIRCNRLSSIGLLHTINSFQFGSYIPGNFAISETGKYIATLAIRARIPENLVLSVQ